MKLMQLRYFLAACRYGSFTRAAEEMHVSQPSVSAAVQELEKEFGVTLFRRDNKKLVLTGEGEYLKGEAGKLLQEADDLAQIMGDLGQKRRKIDLGVPPMIGTFLFPELYSQFKKKYPETEICSREGGLRTLLKLLDEGELDLAILPSNQISSLEYHVEEILKTETLFCVSERHPLAGKREVGIEEIAGEPLILFQGGFYQNELIVKRYEEAGYSPNVIHSSSQFYTIREFIRRGIAAGFMFRDVVGSSGQIAGIPLKEPMNVTVSLVWRRGGYLYQDTAKLIEFVKKEWRP